jgi:hypothetical protein
MNKEFITIYCYSHTHTNKGMIKKSKKELKEELDKILKAGSYVIIEIDKLK